METCMTCGVSGRLKLDESTRGMRHDCPACTCDEMVEVVCTACGTRDPGILLGDVHALTRALKG